MLELDISEPEIERLYAISRTGGGKSAARARIILHLVHESSAGIEDPACAEGERRAFAQYAVRKFRAFGADGLLEKRPIAAPKVAAGPLKLYARMRSPEYLCAVCREAPEA